MSAHALDGVRVLALEQAVAGPFASHLLADMGAEVIKVERPGTGDVIRTWDRTVRGLSTGYVWLNRRKRSVTVDAASEDGRSILHRLAARSDVFLTNFVPGVADKLGLGYAALAAANSRLVYCALSGYGLEGPDRTKKTYDLLMQGEVGLIATTGTPDGPAKVSIPITDIAAGMYSALGIVLALYQREKTGMGQLIDVSMFDSMLEWLGYFPHHLWHEGEEPQRVGMRHHYIVPYGPYLARDDRYVNLVVSSPRDWQTFCFDIVRRPDLASDPRFVDLPARRAHRDVLEAIVEDIIASEDSETWFARLQAANMPFGSVNGIAEVLAQSRVAARKLIREVESPVGPVPTIESALRLSASPVALGPLPALGGDTDSVLSETGYTSAEIASFRAKGVL